MAHIHDVIDADRHFIIDPLSRTVTNLSGKQLLMQFDHNSERFTFELPRYVDGHDMSQCNTIEIHYDNIASNKVDVKSGVYPVEDMQISADDENVVVFSWLISNNATQYDGKLEFNVRFACLSGETIEYDWHTYNYDEVEIGKSKNNGAAVIANNTDVLEAWKKETKKNTLGVVRTAEEMDSILANATADDVGTFYIFMGETTDKYENSAVYGVTEE